VLMICRRKVFSGVGGGIDEKRRSFGFAWWGEGRRMVGMGGVSWGKEIWLRGDPSRSVGNNVGFPSGISGGIAGRPAPPLDQKATQKS